MDKRQWISAVSFSVAVFALWFVFVNWYEKKHPQPPVTPVDQIASTQPATAPAAVAATQSTTAPATQTATISAPTGLHAVDAVDQSTGVVYLGSATKDDANYVLQLTLTPIGAGVDAVTLNHFDAPAAPGESGVKGKKSVYQFQSPLQDVDTTRVLATRRVVINHQEVDLSDKHWNIGPTNADSATFFIFLDDANGHVAKVTKTFQIDHRAATGAQGYEVRVSQEIADARPDSQGKSALDVHSVINGPTPAPSEVEQGTDRSIVTGYADSKLNISPEQNLLAEFKAEELPARKTGETDAEPAKEPAHSIYTKSFAWIGQSSSYFAAMVLPGSSIADASVNGSSLTFTTKGTNAYSAGQTVLVTGVSPDEYNGAYVVSAATDTTFTVKLRNDQKLEKYASGGTVQRAGEQSDLRARVVHVPMTDPEDHIVALSFESSTPKTSMIVYFGPKWREVLDTPHYDSFPRMYDKLLEIRSRMCGWATWNWLIVTLVWILRKFHALLGDWGLSIICLVLIVRTLLHPITKQAQVRMMRMGKMTPEVEKLKKKYADQPDELNREMMKLYKEQGGAILGCLPMFLQTPIWIALWSALQGTFELRQAPFLEIHGHALTWIHDLARPDQLVDLTRWFGGPIPLYFFGWHLRAINLLPILMAVVTYVNQKYFMPMPIAATPEQQQQQKMQRGMSLFFPLMFYTMPSGLNLYYLTSTTLGILESKIIRDHIKEQEEIAKAAAPELVPTKASRTARQNDRQPEKVTAKPGLMARFMEAMQKAQEQAEEMRKGKDKDKGKGK